jgi:DNA mismatch repair protein MutS2
MQPAVLHALEFDRIREALARDTMTPIGHARAVELEPSTDPAEVQYRLNATGEAVALLADGGALSISAPEGLIGALDTLAIGGQPLEPLELIGLADFVDSVDRACAAIRRTSAATPLLAGVAARAASFADEAAATRRAVAASGDVVDTASPALRDIRDS